MRVRSLRSMAWCAGGRAIYHSAASLCRLPRCNNRLAISGGCDDGYVLPPRSRGLVIRSRREAVELSPSGPRLVGIRVAKGLGGYPPVRRSSMLLAPPRRRLPSSGVLVCRRHFRVFRRVADTSPPRAEGNHPNPCLPLRARPLLVAEGDKIRPWVSESLPTAHGPASTGYRDLVLLPDVPRKLPRSRCFRDGYGACSEAPPPRR